MKIIEQILSFSCFKLKKIKQPIEQPIEITIENYDFITFKECIEILKQFLLKKWEERTELIKRGNCPAKILDEIEFEIKALEKRIDDFEKMEKQMFSPIFLCTSDYAELLESKNWHGRSA